MLCYNMSNCQDELVFIPTFILLKLFPTLFIYFLRQMNKTYSIQSHECMVQSQYLDLTV